MKISPALVLLLIAGMPMIVAGSADAQQTYPSKPIRLIVAAPPGGSATTVARIIGQKLSESWGQQVLVDNRGGANAIIGTEALIKSPPDGYTILSVTSTHAINPSLLATPYDAIKDFAPVATLIGAEFLLVLHPSLPVGNLKELISLARLRPGELNYASSGNGTANHLTSEMFSIMAGIKMQHIPYKGGGPALTDLLGGQVQLHFNLPIGLIPHIKNGKLKGIAISGQTRLAALPQVPTFSEAGLPGFDATNWFGILAPSGTPKEIVEKLSAEIARILAIPDIRTTLTSQGMDPLVSTPDQFAARIKADIARYAKVIKDANIKTDP